MGAAASLVSEDQRASMCMAVLEALPVNVYSLAEKQFRTGSFYETKGFSGQRKHCPAFEALGLHEWAVSQIWRHFRRMNETGSGEVTLWEFREYLNLPDDRSTTLLFRCFDEDRDNRIGFLELVIGLWTYCCNCNASLMCLCFDLYDTDHNGRISLAEADYMLEDVFGEEWASNNEAKVAHTWLHERDEALLGAPDLGVDAWSTFVSANLGIQAGILRTRLLLQSKVIGLGFWTYCVSKSATIYLGRSATVEKLLSAHVSEEALKELAWDKNPAKDHNDDTQFVLKVLRRTGPFPRRRKYRNLGGKKRALRGVDAKFRTLSVRDAFERVTVPAGEDATWEAPKAPSALQALMSTLAAIGERAATGRSNGAPLDDPQSLAKERNQSPTKHSSNRPVPNKTGPPEALALLKTRPGLNGSPLGSPTALMAATAAGNDSTETDPAIANCFDGLKPLPETQQTPGSRTGGGGGGRGTPGRGSSRSVVSPRARDGRSTARAGAASGAGEISGGGKTRLARTGRDLVIAGELRGIGSGGEGVGGGGEGPLSARLLGT